MISAGSNPPQAINVIVEIPKGSRNKYELDKNNGQIKLDRVIYSSVMFPGDYGFVPSTLWDDGDPLDVLVLMRFPTFPGCLIEARPIGMLDMVDTGDSDKKILAVPIEDPYYAHVMDLKDAGKALIEEIAHFFEVYKQLQPKKWVEVKGWQEREAAEEAIMKAIKNHDSSELCCTKQGFVNYEAKQ